MKGKREQVVAKGYCVASQKFSKDPEKPNGVTLHSVHALRANAEQALAELALIEVEGLRICNATITVEWET